MKLSITCLLLPALLTLIGAAPTTDTPQRPFAHRQTIRQAADHVGFLLKNVTMGSIATAYPSSSEMAGYPFVANEYHAPCSSFPNLTFLLLPISQSTRNILSDPQMRVSYLLQENVLEGDKDGRGTGHGDPAKGKEEGGRSRMDYGRVTLTGRMHPLNYPSSNPNTQSIQIETLQKCFTSTHPDARRWLPGTEGAHVSFWAEMVVESVYYVGGFGDLHYIGHIPLDMIHLEPPRSTIG